MGEAANAYRPVGRSTPNPWAGGLTGGIWEDPCGAQQRDRTTEASVGLVVPTGFRVEESSLVFTRGGPQADPAVLVTVATACRDHEILTFDYSTRHGTTSRRRVEPHGVVAVAGLWYLVAYDTDRDDWRLYRLDRLTHPTPTGRRGPPRSSPPRTRPPSLRTRSPQPRLATTPSPPSPLPPRRCAPALGVPCSIASSP